jgi:hypothetical protein
VCDATAGPASPEETCDYADDDCDGSVDEGFINEGVYDTVAHCGACNINCNNLWPGGPENFNVVPVCTVVDEVATCDFQCAGLSVDADGVPDNGCELTPDLNGVYVTRPGNGGVDNPNCGAYDAPCASVGYGIARAVDEGRRRVRVSDGLFREAISLQAGVDVLGGHNGTNWVRDPDVNTTLLDGYEANAPADRAVVRAVGITTATELSGFTLTAPNAGAGGNSVALSIRNSSNALVIRNNVIQGGNGGAGASSDRGLNGDGGVNGAGGADSEIRSNCNATLPGAAGGIRTCTNPLGTAQASGGLGGISGCPSLGEENGPGQSGQGASPGAGGGGGHSFQACQRGFSCCVDPDEPLEPSPGVTGGDGEDGGGGAGADGSSSVVNGQWRGAGGAEGNHGSHGSGGGGGGTAAGVDAFTFHRQYYYGARGGGGGSGGCGATAGVGGTAGGGSLGVMMVFDTEPRTPALMPMLVENRLRRGLGGAGGAGGNGGTGGERGVGGTDGSGLDDGVLSFCMFDGALGADGGRGGHGGGGGGGAGGASFDLFVSGSGGLDPGYGETNLFEVANDVATGGRGGAGGNSNNTDVGLGVAGTGGVYGNVRVEP